MTWRTRLLPASYRGVRFFVDRDSRDGGRRIALHEYPLRDIPYAEDLGRQARHYSVEAVVIGPTYDVQLKALIAALETGGAAVLTHPTYGMIKVMCQRYRAEITTAEGGMARVSLDLVEAGTNAAPLALPDSLEQVKRKAEDLLTQVEGYIDTAQGYIDAVQGYVDLGYRIIGLPSLVFEAGRSLLLRALDPLAALGAGLGMSTGNRAAHAAGLGDARRQIDTIAGSPTLVGATLTAQVRVLRTNAGSPWAAYQALRPLVSWGADLPAVPATTPARVAQAANQALIVAAVRDCALAQACVAALDGVAAAGDASALANLAAGIPATAQELRALSADLQAQIDVRQAGATDGAYAAWADLRVAVALDLGQRALAAPTLLTVVPAQTEPVLVIAYRLYGDASRGAEIARRNGVAHPGFVPGGLSLEVRSA